MLILGGTFDPPHIGHLVLAEAARAELGEETAVLMPAGDPWRKTGSPESLVPSPGARRVTSAPIRLAMVRAAVREANADPGPGARDSTQTRDSRQPTANSQQPTALAVDARETRRRGPTYTAETLAELAAEGHGTITLVLGSDSLADMVHWQEPERIVEMARFAVVSNPATQPLEQALATLEAAVPGAGAKVVRLETVPFLRITSTLVRQRVAAGLSIRFLVPRAVERYIARHGLYGA